MNEGSGRNTHKHTHTHLFTLHTNRRTCASTHHTHTHTHTFDGADDLVQVFGVVAVRPAARADLQRVVGSVLCKKLTHITRVNDDKRLDLCVLFIFFFLNLLFAVTLSSLTSAHSRCSGAPKYTFSSLSPFFFFFFFFLKMFFFF